MADVALRHSANVSELATYLSHVYRQPIPIDHAALSTSSTSNMQWLWNFAPLPRNKICVHRRENNITALCAAHARLPAGAVGISMISPNLGLTRLEKYGVALPRCTRAAGSVATLPLLPMGTSGDAPVVRAGEEAFVEVIRIDYAAYVRGRDIYTGIGGRASVTAMDKEGGPNGCWFLTQRGSGVFVRAGRVLRVADRSELVERLNISLVHRGKRHRRDDLNFINKLENSVPLCPHVRSHGFDTLIFDNHDGGFGANGAHELVSCQTTCIEHKLNDSCVPELRTGWGASLPCACNGSLPVVNCALTGVDKVGPWPAIRHHYAGGFRFWENAGAKIPSWPVMPTVRLPMCTV